MYVNYVIERNPQKCYVNDSHNDIDSFLQPIVGISHHGFIKFIIHAVTQTHTHSESQSMIDD